MKQALLYTLLSIALVLLLTAGVTPRQEPSPTPAPLSADAALTFTVQTDTGIQTVTMAEYLPGVVAGEMPALFEEEALKAQAVAARTYILHRMGREVAAHPEADVCSSPACCKAYAEEEQLRRNWGTEFETYSAKITRAVTATDGQVLCYEGSPIEAVFHASSAGATESSGEIWNDRPYLIGVVSPETAADVPNYVTTVRFTPEELRAEFPDIHFPTDPALWLRNLTTNDSGRVQQITVGDQAFTGAQLRSALGLRSAAFTVAYTDGQFTFTVTGHGHGVGMSQYGANTYAKQGWEYEAILAHYYPGTELREWRFES